MTGRMKIRAILVVLMLAALSIGGCATRQWPADPAIESYSARIEPVERWTLRFGVPGILTERLAQVGNDVAAGDGLAALRADDYDARVRDTQAALKEAMEKSEATRTQLTAADLKVVSPGVTVPAEPVALRERVLQAVVKTAKAGSEAQQAQWARSATVLRADRAGKIVYWHVRPGDPVATGAPILDLEDDSRLQVVAAVPDAIARATRVGRRAVVIVAKNADQSFDSSYDAIVRFVELGAQPRSQARVTLEVVERASLRNGMLARVQLL